MSKGAINPIAGTDQQATGAGEFRTLCLLLTIIALLASPALWWILPSNDLRSVACLSLGIASGLVYWRSGIKFYPVQVFGFFAAFAAIVCAAAYATGVGIRTPAFAALFVVALGSTSAVGARSAIFMSGTATAVIVGFLTAEVVFDIPAQPSPVSIVGVTVVYILLLSMTVSIAWRRGSDQASAHGDRVALQDSLERYRGLTDGSLVGVCIARGESLAFANQALADILGMSRTSELGRLEDFSGLLDENERVRFADYLAVRIEDDVQADTVLFTGRKGNALPLVLSITGRAVNWDGAPAVQMVVLDVTTDREQRHAIETSEARLNALHQMDHAILAAASIEEVAVIAMQTLRRLIPCDRIDLRRFDDDGTRMHIESVVGLDSPTLAVGRTFPVDQQRFDELNAQLMPYIFELDPGTVSSEQNAHLRTLGIASVLRGPIRINREMYASLALYSSENDAFDADHVELLQEVITVLGIAGEQTLLRSELQRRVAELEREAEEKLARNTHSSGSA
jgi:PAS domain-containing protein